MARAKKPKTIAAITHEDSRRNIPTAEYQSVMKDEERHPVQVAYERRNRDLDPQLVWRGKDEQDAEPLIAQAPPLYIQEKVHPKVLIDSLKRYSREETAAEETIDLFADFNGLPEGDARTEFYRHEANWSNRMILGDSLHVMTSLAEREGLRGKVQCIYMDPPYGIKFNSNFQWSTTSRDVKDGNRKHITREPEQVKAFRDTWRDGIHSYLAYLRDRLTVARDLLTESGSIFVQIGDENVHRVRAVMDEVFGDENHVALIPFVRTTGQTARHLSVTNDYICFYARNIELLKYRQLFVRKNPLSTNWYRFPDGSTTSRSRVGDVTGLAAYKPDNITAQSGGETTRFTVSLHGRSFPRLLGGWKTNATGMQRLIHACRVHEARQSIQFIRLESDFDHYRINNFWTDTRTGNFTEPKQYVVQTASKIIQRCILMTTDPGDLVLDPTCGAGTTAFVAEQWGRRWITIDTSRVALALARARVMGARYPYYLLADSREGQKKEAQITRRVPSNEPTYGRIRQGFVYQRVPHITLKQIANNAEIDVIWERHQETLEPLRRDLRAALGESWEEWQVPRDPDDDWPTEARELHAAWWKARIARQKDIDASIAANAPFEYLYDKPYEDRKAVRVAGPFTVESLSPHRLLAVDENDELIDKVAEPSTVDYGETRDFAAIMLENLRMAGVQQARKSDRIAFSSVNGWPGKYICAEGHYQDGNRSRRAGIMIGPEFGTVSRPDLVAAAREAAECGFDALIACAFSYDAACSDLDKLGRMRVLKARMNADLHMATDLKQTDAGNLFVVFGEPDIQIHDEADDEISVEVRGIDVFDPGKGEIRSDDVDGIACWFIDTEYDEESFFVRHAYFLGARDPYKSLKTSLKAEIDREAWASLRRARSRPFAKPRTGRIAVKVINHLGDEAMKVFRV
ncbi:MAG: site-specific DNA-methyltransferase [Gemmatimonadota bacterium]|nr:site-specific DNA-methyltransferase [Gemmatimonadota bacterium]